MGFSKEGLPKEIRQKLTEFKRNRTPEQIALDRPSRGQDIISPQDAVSLILWKTGRTALEEQLDEPEPQSDPSAIPSDVRTHPDIIGGSSTHLVEGGDLLAKLGFVFPILSNYDKSVLRQLKKRWDPVADSINSPKEEEPRKKQKISKERRQKIAKELHPHQFKKEEGERAYMEQKHPELLSPKLQQDILLQVYGYRDEDWSDYNNSQDEEQTFSRAADIYIRQHIEFTRNPNIPKETIYSFYAQSLHLFAEPSTFGPEDKKDDEKNGNTSHPFDPKTLFFGDKQVTIFPPLGSKYKDDHNLVTLYIEDITDNPGPAKQYKEFVIGDNGYFFYETGEANKLTKNREISTSMSFAGNERHTTREQYNLFQEAAGILTTVFKNVLPSDTV